MERLRALIIDDSLTIRALVQQLVAKDRDFAEVAVAGDVEQARALMETMRPHVITLDLSMPGISGLGFLDDLRDRPHAPIVVLSASTRAGTAATDEALARGADYCFDKAKVILEASCFLRVLKKAAKRRAARNRRRQAERADTPEQTTPQPA